MILLLYKISEKVKELEKLWICVMKDQIFSEFLSASVGTEHINGLT